MPKCTYHSDTVFGEMAYDQEKANRIAKNIVAAIQKADKAGFEARIAPIACGDSFSRVASGVGGNEHCKEIIHDLCKAELLADEEKIYLSRKEVHLVALAITTRIIADNQSLRQSTK